MDDDLKTYLEETIWGFVNDPPDSDWQGGFLSGILAAYEEAVSDHDPDLVTRAKRCLMDYVTPTGGRG